MSLSRMINEYLAIAISIIIPILVLAFWVGGLASKTEAHETALVKITSSQEEFQKEVLQRLSRIEGKLSE